MVSTSTHIDRLGDTPTCSIGVLIEILGISKRSIERLLQKGELRRVAHGKYDLLHALSWHVENRAKEMAAPTGSSTGEVIDLAAEKARLTRAQRQRSEIDLAILQGVLIDVEVLRFAAQKLATVLAGHMEKIPGDLLRTCPQLTKADLERITRTLALARGEMVNRAPEEVATSIDDWLRTAASESPSRRILNKHYSASASASSDTEEGAA